MVGGSIQVPFRGAVVGATPVTLVCVELLALGVVVVVVVGVVVVGVVVVGVVVVGVVVVVVVAMLLLVTVADIENLAPSAVVASIMNVFEPFCHRAVSKVISKPLLLS
jgi:hypothetical protein